MSAYLLGKFLSFLIFPSFCSRVNLKEKLRTIRQRRYKYFRANSVDRTVFSFSSFVSINFAFRSFFRWEQIASQSRDRLRNSRFTKRCLQTFLKRATVDEEITLRSLEGIMISIKFGNSSRRQHIGRFFVLGAISAFGSCEVFPSRVSDRRSRTNADTTFLSRGSVRVNPSTSYLKSVSTRNTCVRRGTRYGFARLFSSLNPVYCRRCFGRYLSRWKISHPSSSTAGFVRIYESSFRTINA